MAYERYIVNPREESHQWTYEEFERVSMFLERLMYEQGKRFDAIEKTIPGFIPPVVPVSTKTADSTHIHADSTVIKADAT